MAKATYIQPGSVLNYKNTGSDAIEAGTVVVFSTRIGIAAADIPAGTVGGLATEGVFSVPKAASLAVAAGEAVYYNSTNGNFDKTSSGGIAAGYAVAAAAVDDTVVSIKLPG